MKGKKTIFLAGDSTVQSYTPDKKPQMGWGQLLYRFFVEADSCNSYNRDSALGSHVMTYEMQDIIIENHALAARSSRSFIEQGRLDNIMAVAEPGDIMLVQFAHNDAYEAREERFVPVDKFGEWLDKYNLACKERGMKCIFVTPVTMRVFDENGHCQIAFSEYRDAMLAAAKEKNVECIDLSFESTRLIESIGPEAARDMYLWLWPGEYPGTVWQEGNRDNAHFQEYGALNMAAIVAKGLKSVEELKDLLVDDFNVQKQSRVLPEGFSWEEDSNMQEAAKQEILKRK